MKPTIHEIGQVDNKPAFLCVVVGENTIVYEIPSKGIGYHDDYPLGSHSIWWSRHISLETMNSGDFTAGLSLVDVAFEAVWTGHLVS